MLKGRTDKALPQQLLEKYAYHHMGAAAAEGSFLVLPETQPFMCALECGWLSSKEPHQEGMRDGAAVGGQAAAGVPGVEGTMPMPSYHRYQCTIRTPLLSTVLVPFRKLYDHFN